MGGWEAVGSMDSIARDAFVEADMEWIILTR